LKAIQRRETDCWHKSFHEKAGMSQVCFSFYWFSWFSGPRRHCRYPSSRTLFERFSLRASWVYSFQQVLLPDDRPWPPSF
jgi:hypothetical protein